MCTARSRSAAVALTAPTGAVLRRVSWSALVGRRWRAVPPPHPCLLCAAALSVLPIRLLMVGTPPKEAGRQASKVHVEISARHLLCYTDPGANPDRVLCL